MKKNNSIRVKLCAKQYWDIHASEFPALKNLATQVFGMVASSAASERGFSTLSFIQNKFRKKLINIKMNAPKVLGTTGTDPNDWEYSSDEDENSDIDENREVEEQDGDDNDSDMEV
jgi:hypothetical protein